MELKYPKPEAKLVIVPSDPTPEMLNAYDEARGATTMHPPGSIETYNPHQSYWALLNAAPRVVNSDMDIFPRAEIARLRKIEEAAMALSTKMADTEAEGGNYDLVDEPWVWLTVALQPLT